VPAVFDPTAAFTDLTTQAERAYVDEHGELEETGEGDWREIPVAFDVFVESRDHLHLPPVFELQREAVVGLLGADPTRIFEAPDPAREAARQYQLAVLLWGKGSGKDYLCSIIVAYLVYVLLCLRDPAKYFELAPGEYLDIVNVAYNADQAKKVFFAKFKERLYRWRWLKQNFDVHEAGRRKWSANKGLPVVEINDLEVIFPRGIRCFSRHSQNESYEGLNVLVWLMDEASAFLSAAKKENAGAIYQTLRTSAGSRFGMRWIGFIISYPRHADDFTMTKVAEAKANPEAGILGHGPHMTWEVNELRGRQGLVEIRGVKVPVELANDFTLDFEEALAKYCCQPPLAKDALIKDGDRVRAAVQTGRRPLIEWEPVVTRRSGVDKDQNDVARQFSAVKLTRLGKPAKGTKLFMHGDPARTTDAFALGIGHGVPATIVVYVPAGEVLTAEQLAEHDLDPAEFVPWERDVTRTVIDALIVWRPDPTRNQHVDLLNVKDVLQQLVEHYGRGAFGGVTFDQYDSAETVQWLEAKRVPTENEQWSNPFQHRIYRGARGAFYNDLVTLPDHPTITSEDPRAPGAIYELLRVEEIEGHKIDHPEGGSKDLADVVVRIIEHVTGQAKKGFSFSSLRSGTQDQLAGASKKVNPKRPPSPVTQQLQEAERERAETRPQGELEPATGTVRRSKLSYGSARAGPRRPST
jgi:hypothetical protein